MLKRQIIELRKNVYTLLDVKGEKFAYAVLKNKNKIDSLWEDLKKELQAIEKDEPSKEFMDFLTEREQIAIKYSKKDEKGNPMTKTTKRGEDDIEQYVIEDEESMKKEVDALTEKNKDIIEARKQQEIRITNLENSVLDEEIEVEFHMVKKLPETISARELEAAGFMLEK